jgi:hypothetical protein
MTSPCCNAALAQKWAYWLDGWKVELLVCGLCRKSVGLEAIKCG